jgi:5-methylcytosine-specific restriction protein A
MEMVHASPESEAPSTFILTWNPRYPEAFPDYQEAIRLTASGRIKHSQWSCQSGQISRGDRAFLFRQGTDRGMVARGVFTSGQYPDRHWSGREGYTKYGDVNWELVLATENRLPVEDLLAEVPEVPWNSIYGSGIQVHSESAARTLYELWVAHTNALIYRSADEPRAIDDRTFPEGALTRIMVNKYERDPQAREECLQHWGYRCLVCDFSFEDRYGPLGQNFIHVHHTIELSLVPRGYRVNPINDLRPVCPNCHAMLHQVQPALTVEQLKQHLRRTGAS